MKTIYQAVINERTKSYITWVDDYIFDPTSQSLELRISGRKIKDIPLSDPKYISVEFFNATTPSQTYPRIPDQSFIGGGHPLCSK